MHRIVRIGVVVAVIAGLAVVAVATIGRAPAPAPERAAGPARPLPDSARFVLRQLAGEKGCWSHARAGGCRAFRVPATSYGEGIGLQRLAALTISPDGRTVYAAANPYSNLIVAFTRAGDGSLAPLAGRAGCVVVGSPRCEGPIYRQRQLSALAVSPDGDNLYAAADYKYVQAVQAFGRDTRGGLRNAHHGISCAGAHEPLRGTDGQNRCGLATALGSPSDLAVEPGGRELYATAANHLTILRRTETGGIQATGCIGSPGELLRGARCAPARAMAWATAVAPAPDGRNVYVASSQGVAVLARDADDGTLTQLPGSAGCVTQTRTPRCATGRSVGRTWEPATARSGGTQVAVSPDGRNVYVAGRYGIAVFARDRRTGALTQLPGRSGCIAEAPQAGCTPGRALRNIEGLVVSPDGASVYGAAFVSRAVAVLRRTTSGALRQAAGPGGCISGDGRHRCSRARAVGAPTAIAITPDATTVYVASGEAGLAVFARARR